jgi:hypothetical protein
VKKHKNTHFLQRQLLLLHQPTKNLNRQTIVLSLTRTKELWISTILQHDDNKTHHLVWSLPITTKSSDSTFVGIRDVLGNVVG